MIAHGSVQGVWFRDSTQKEAERLGLKGYVRNLSDGTVEIVALGPPSRVNSLSQWAREGPPLAQVTQLELEEVAYSNSLPSFEVRY